MIEDMFDIVEQMVLGSEEFRSYGISYDSEGTALLDPKFVKQIVDIVQNEVRKIYAGMLVEGWPNARFTATQSVRRTLDEFGKKNQAKFQNIGFDTRRTGAPKESGKVILQAYLDINLLYPYHWFPITFEMEF